MKQTFDHPLEKVFDMDSGTVDIEQQYSLAEQPPQAITTIEKDEEDIAVDEKIDKVYEAAMDAFENQSAYMEVIEPRYAARNAEVAANYLNIALNAAATRAKVKTDRRRASTFVPFTGGNKTTNNLIVADRNELLKMIKVDSDDKEIK